MIFNHKSVLLNETVDSLCVKPQGIYVDGTLGGGGHASEVAARLGGTAYFHIPDTDALSARNSGISSPQLKSPYSFCCSAFLAPFTFRFYTFPLQASLPDGIRSCRVSSTQLKAPLSIRRVDFFQSVADFLQKQAQIFRLG